MDGSAARTILVAGATGYVGGRLIPCLLEKGYRVRCLARDTSRIEGRGWKQIEVATGDVLHYETLLPALRGSILPIISCIPWLRVNRALRNAISSRHRILGVLPRRQESSGSSI